MSEERTQAPTKRRRQFARERGQVARSPELTAASGLLAAVVLLGAFGGDLATSLLDLVRAPLTGSPEFVTGPDAVAASFRSAAWRLAAPLGMIAGGVVLAMVLTHQMQVGGLWVPALLAPDPARLTPGGPGWSARAGRGLWGWARSAVVLAVAAWALKVDGSAFLRLGELESPALVRAAGGLIVGLAYKLGLATLALGLLDFAIQHRRVEAMLRQTPDEHREDQKAIDGDPAVRARRLRLARSWRFNPAEILSGAVLVLSGSGGLTVVLGGGPPPRRVTVLGQARGSAGRTLRRSAERARLNVVEAPELAQHFAGGASSGRVVPPGLAAELTALWPRPA